MKIWEIKAQALRLMFADTDIEFSEEDFTSNAVYENANTREKLVRMNDSIQRGIDLYYQYVGERTSMALLTLTQKDAFGNYIDISTARGIPLRVDLHIYKPAYCSSLTYTSESTCESNGEIWYDEEKVLEINQVNLYYDQLNDKIYFQDQDYIKIYEDFTIKVIYKYKPARVFITSATNDQNNVDTQVPTEVQYMLPYFIKAELFEEDEPNLSAQARNLYIQFLVNTRKPFSNSQAKVKRAGVFNK